MGEVYRARDTRLDRTVAIKVLPGHLASNPELRLRFEREAKAVSSLNHPHICVLHDIGRQEGIDYLVLEYLEGESLHDRLEKGPLPLDQALRFATEIAEALDKAHRQGVVHRDLKPRQRDADAIGDEAPGLRAGQGGGPDREGGGGRLRRGDTGQAADGEGDAAGHDSLVASMAARRST
jgi:hypothetical protein